MLSEILWNCCIWRVVKVERGGSLEFGERPGKLSSGERTEATLLCSGGRNGFVICPPPLALLHSQYRSERIQDSSYCIKFWNEVPSQGHRNKTFLLVAWLLNPKQKGDCGEIQKLTGNTLVTGMWHHLSLHLYLYCPGLSPGASTWCLGEGGPQIGHGQIFDLALAWGQEALLFPVCVMWPP